MGRSNEPAMQELIKTVDQSGAKKEAIMYEIDKKNKALIVDCYGEKVRLKGYFDMFPDIFGEEKRLLGLYLETMDGTPYEDLSCSFGEFVGQYGSFFVNVGPLYDLNGHTMGDWIQEQMIAFPTGGFKSSGDCVFPAYRLSPHVMEALFSLEQIRDYKLDFLALPVLYTIQETETAWVQESLDKEKASFDEFIASRGV